VSRRINVTALTWALSVVAVDAAVKAWARASLADAPRHIVGPLWLRLSYNSGLSFSVSTHGASWAALITVAVALGVLALTLRARVGAPTAGFGLLLGGGVANVVDRVMASPHVVTDFISVGSFPVFNLADAAVTLGFVVLMICTVRGERLLT